MIDFALPAEIADLEAEILRFAENELRPKMRDFEAAGSWDEATLKSFDAFAIGALDIPESRGGVEAGSLAKVVVLEALAFGDAGGLPGADPIGPAAAAALAHPDSERARGLISSCIARESRSVLIFGKRSKVDWLPGARAPEFSWVSDGQRLKLYDTKTCVATPVVAGAFDASGGIALDLMGAAALDDLILEPKDALLLRGRARLWPAGVALGISRASLDYAIAYARQRVVMGRPVAHHQGNAFAIAEATTNVDAARVSVRAAARRLDEGHEDAGFWATLAYLDAIDAALDATNLGVMLLGGHGYIEDHPAEKWFREARALAQMLGGRDAALEDAEGAVLDTPDPLLEPDSQGLSKSARRRT